MRCRRLKKRIQKKEDRKKEKVSTITRRHVTLQLKKKNTKQTKKKNRKVENDKVGNTNNREDKTKSR